MLDKSQLPNALLYVTSTGAQVWAAFLIFYVLLWRDLEKSTDDRKRQIWNSVNEHTEEFRKALIVALDNRAGRYSQYNLDKFTILASRTSWESFERYLEKLAMSSLIHQHGREFGITDPLAFWTPLSAADSELKSMTGYAKPEKPKIQIFGFRIGMVLIGFNLVVLGLHPVLCASWRLAGWSVLITSLANIGFGVGMVVAVKRSLTPVYSKPGEIHVEIRSKFVDG